MVRLVKISAFALLLSVIGIVHASAETITDPIVRTKAGGGSIPIFAPLPFEFSFGVFPSDPDGPLGNCFVDPDIDPAGILVSCAFQNLTGQTLTELDFDFDYTGVPDGPPPVETFFTEDPNEFWNFRSINQFSALFQGGGIPSGFCDEIDGCFGGEFIVELVGFPEGTIVDMTAPAAVPEPMTLTLLATGLALGAGARRRTKKEERRTKV
jgi:hypothetical protein